MRSFQAKNGPGTAEIRENSARGLPVGPTVQNEVRKESRLKSRLLQIWGGGAYKFVKIGAVESPEVFLRR